MILSANGKKWVESIIAHCISSGMAQVSAIGLNNHLVRVIKRNETLAAQINERRKPASNTRSPKLSPCDCVREAISSKYLDMGYKYCHWCGRQLRASA